VRIAHLSTGFRLHPAASTSLYDLAEIYLKEGRPGAAAACLLHALELRPNHPEALLLLASIFPKEDELVEHALARIIALGGRDDEAQVWATKNGAEARLARATALASDVIVPTWPYGGPDFGSPEHIEIALDAPEAPPKPPKPTIQLYRKLSPFAEPSKTAVAGASGEGGAAGGLSKPLRIGLVIAVLLLLVAGYFIYTSVTQRGTVG
jgi:tetratricopeptide (TPR) repeat protein